MEKHVWIEKGDYEYADGTRNEEPIVILVQDGRDHEILDIQGEHIADGLNEDMNDDTPALMHVVEQETTATMLWAGYAPDRETALDLYAQDAGYKDYESIPDEIGGGETIIIRIGQVPEKDIEQIL